MSGTGPGETAEAHSERRSGFGYSGTVLVVSEQEGSKLAQRWERAVTSTLLQLTANALIGALCQFKAPELQGVRRLGIKYFPNISCSIVFLKKK